MKCTKCGYLYSDSDDECPKCGNDLEDFVFDIIDDLEENQSDEEDNDKDEIDISYAKQMEYEYDDIDEIEANTINSCAEEIEKLEKEGMFEEGVSEEVKYKQRYGDNISNNSDLESTNFSNEKYNRSNSRNIQSNQQYSEQEYGEDDYDDYYDREYVSDEYLSGEEAEMQSVYSDTVNLCFMDETEVEMNEDSNIRREIEKPPLLSNTKKAVLVATVALIVFSITGVFYIAKRAILDKFGASLNNNDYVAASNYYTKLMEKSRGEANKLIVEKIDDIFSRYSDDKISSSDAVDELKQLANINSNALENIEVALEDFKNIKISEAYFEAGEEYYSKSEFENAIVNYYSVTKVDKHYKEAQKKLKLCIDKYTSNQIKEADNLMKEEKYDGAIELMQYGLQLLKNNTNLQNKLNYYKAKKFEAFKEDIYLEANDLKAEGDYVGAIQVIKDALEFYGQIDELKKKHDEFRNDMLKATEGYIKAQRYNKLINMLDKYAKIYPEDNDVNKIIEEYKPYVVGGYALADLEWSKTEGRLYTNKQGKEYKNAQGNTFDSVVELCGYENLDTKGYITIANDNYVKIKGIIGYSAYSYYKNGKAILVIKADDKVIYKSKVISANTKDIKLDVDIPNCKTITISWEPKNSSSPKPYGIALCDFKLVNKDGIVNSKNTTKEESGKTQPE